jgi:hypothetical protein
MSDIKFFKLSDASIGLIAKTLQVAMLTGTDVVDNLRMICFEVNDADALDPTLEYLENFDKNLDTLMDQAVETMPTYEQIFTEEMEKIELKEVMTDDADDADEADIWNDPITRGEVDVEDW